MKMCSLVVVKCYIFVTSLFIGCSSAIEDTKLYFEVISMKDCSNANDSLRITNIQIPPVIELTNSNIKLEWSADVTKTLPSNWDVTLDVRVKLPFFNNLFIPFVCGKFW
jgi:hypothetical protein